MKARTEEDWLKRRLVEVTRRASARCSFMVVCVVEARRKISAATSVRTATSNLLFLV